MAHDMDRLLEMSEEIWENSIIPSLSEFIGIKALSPLFEPDWEELGELEAVSYTHLTLPTTVIV